MPERLYERHERLVEKGGRQLAELRYMTQNYFGEGGKLLTREQQHQLFDFIAMDPNGTAATDTLVRRQKENKIEGTPHMPADWWTWAIRESERMLGHKLGEG